MSDELRRTWLDASRETDKLRDEHAAIGNRLQLAIERETTAWKAYCAEQDSLAADSAEASRDAGKHAER